MTPEELKQIRKRLKLSQRKLAEKLGVNPMCVYRWERGLNSIRKPIETLIRKIEMEQLGDRNNL